MPLGIETIELLAIMATLTPPLWTDLVKILTSKPGPSSSFLQECTDFKNGDLFFQQD